jgi:5-oxoprolinase (ATP-hydrolysing)
MTLSVLSQRRGPHPPFGLADGESGAIGRNTLRRADGDVVELGGITQQSVAEGDVLVIKTPGGGGFGNPKI